MNKSILMGRLVHDPEIRYAQGRDGEMAVANFRLAVDRNRKVKSDVNADFFRCTAFGWLAEFAEKYLNKGIKVVVSGRMQNDNYTNRDGEKVYGMCLMLETIEFAESKSAQQDGESDVDENDERPYDEDGTSNQPESKGRESRTGGSKTGRSRDRDDSDRSKRRPESGRRNGSRSSRDNRSNDTDEQFGDVDEYEEDCNFN